MKKVKGWWCPDYDHDLQLNIGQPEFDGRLTYQFKAFRDCLKYIERFNHAVDVGAHIGLLTYPMARTFASVTAIEPVPDHYECLLANMRDIDNVQPMNIAFGNVARDRIDMALKAPWSLKARIRTTESLPNVRVEMRTLDSFGFPKIDFLKIDCEGYELFVLQGAKQTIERDRPLILVEQKPGNTRRYKIADMAAIELLKSWGATEHWQKHGDYCLGWNAKS